MDTVTMVMVGLAVALLIYALIRGGGLANDGVKLAVKPYGTHYRSCLPAF